MSLLALWRSSPEQIGRYAARQIVALAGDGRLKDGSVCSTELRAYLAEVPWEALERYAADCLDEGFDNSGFVLQDLINEIGKRLEFTIVSGLYRGRRNAVGFDGIWSSGNEPKLIIEVKTTDTYNVNLDQVARYRQELIASGELTADSSILFVVGRQDTGSLESQIRGSPHAWNMRVVGTASLLRLLRIKEKLDSTAVASRIRALLRPVEYTRVDGIVDLMFDATSEVEAGQIDQDVGFQSDEVDTPEDGRSVSATDVETLRANCVRALSRHFGKQLTRRRRSLYGSVADDVRVAIAVSKRYGRSGRAYWYAYYPSQHEYLAGAKKGFYVLAALDLPVVYAVPADALSRQLPRMKTTTRDGTTYWHVEGRLEDREYRLKVAGGEISLEEFAIPLGSSQGASIP